MNPATTTPHPPGLSFREKPHPADAGAVEGLVRDTGFFHPAEVAVARELVEEALARGPASGYRFLFAEREGVLLGYACYGEIPMTVGSFDLYWIATAPAAQGQGVGGALLREAERRMAALGCRRVWVETSSRALYEPTRRFYRKAGYTQTAVLPAFYAEHDDKVIFSKTLGT